MGRPRNDAAASVRPRVAPPAALSPRMAALWAREFDRFPPGYYVPADINGMLVYLHTVAEYDAAMARAAAAKKPADARAERVEVRAIRKQLLLLQRALRMYPTTRGDPAKMAGIAHAADVAATQGEAEPSWRAIFNEAGVMPTEKRTQ